MMGHLPVSTCNTRSILFLLSRVLLNMDVPLDMSIEDLRLTTADQVTPSDVQKRRLPRHRPGEKPFLQGPIPSDWLTTAAGVPGKALAVGIAIWHLAFLKKSRTVKLTSTVLQSLSVDRKAGYSRLRALEQAGLVTVSRRRGACPMVTIQETSGDDGQQKSSILG